MAAVGDINSTSIGGNNTFYIQNLHITTTPSNDEGCGLVAHFKLSDWWNTALTCAERGAIDNAIGDVVTRTQISSASQTAQSWLRSMARQISAVHPQLASKLRAKATGIETGAEADDYWQRQLDAVRSHWRCLNFERAREELRGIGYRMREENALPDARAAFDDLQAALLQADPYYTGVMDAVLPIIKSRPGIVQSVLAKGLPDIDIERFRYAMYYGEVIGDIQRVKNGRSYGLFPAVTTVK